CSFNQSIFVGPRVALPRALSPLALPRVAQGALKSPNKRRRRRCWRLVRACSRSSRSHITGSTGLDTAPTTTFSFTSSTPSTLSVSLASITWSGGDTPPGGLSAVLGSALTTSITSGPGGGFVTATFSAADNNFDFLAAGETLTIVYN